MSARINKDGMQMVEEFAEWLNENTPDMREEILRQLEEATYFCWHCFCDHTGTCYCRRDE